MEPSIAAYNIIARDHNGLSLDDLLNETMPGIITHADFNKFQQLIGLITKQGMLLSGNNTGWSYNHDDIISFLQLEPGQKVNIFNIDHHHDLGYDKVTVDNKFYRVNCANWVYDLNQKGHLNTYYWIGNNNSQMPAPEQIAELPHYVSSNDIFILQNVSFDKIFISTSPSWIPKKYHPLSHTAVELLGMLSTANIDK